MEAAEREGLAAARRETVDPGVKPPAEPVGVEREVGGRAVGGRLGGLFGVAVPAGVALRERLRTIVQRSDWSASPGAKRSRLRQSVRKTSCTTSSAASPTIRQALADERRVQAAEQVGVGIGAVAEPLAVGQVVGQGPGARGRSVDETRERLRARTRRCNSDRTRSLALRDDTV